MNRILPIVKTTGAVFQGLALATIMVMNALMGYIMFAPNDLPKPFYLSYSGDSVVPPGGAATAGHSAAAEPTATPGPEIIRVYKPGQGVMVDTGTKIVNLADPGGRKYLKATITIEVAPPLTAEAKTAATASSGEGAAAATPDPAMVAFTDKMTKRMPIINDTLTTLLAGKTFESIYTVDGKELLRQEILKQLNVRLPDLQVIAVYFTEFVVQ